MLKLRKILLCDYIYYLIFIIVIIISTIKLTIPKKSIYTEQTKEVIGIITNIEEKDKQITLTIKAKENLLVTYYLNKLNIKFSLGDKIKIIGEFNKPHNQKTKNLFDYQK